MTKLRLESFTQASADQVFAVLSIISTGFWHKDKIYLTPKGDAVTFKNSIIFCSDNNDYGQGCYKIVSNRKRFGNDRTVIYYIAASFRFDVNQKIQVIESVPEILKKSFFKDSAEVRREFDNSIIIEHLGVRKPLYVEDKHYSYMVMREMPGVDFFDFIDKLFKERIVLQAGFLLAMTNALFQTMINQIVRYGITHTDMKPENLMLKLPVAVLKMSKQDLEKYNPKEVKFNCIDYDFARKFSESFLNGYVRGTENYISPEVMAGDYIGAGEKPDIYALGIVLRMLWNVGEECDFRNPKNRFLNESDVKLMYFDFFLHSILNLSTFRKICILIVKMSYTCPYDRYSLEQCIKVFDYILQSSGIDPNPIYVATTGYERTLEEITPSASSSSLKNNSNSSSNPNGVYREMPYYNNHAVFKSSDAFKPGVVKTQSLGFLPNVEKSKVIFKRHPASYVGFTRLGPSIEQSEDAKVLEKIANKETHLGPISGPLKNRSGNSWPFWDSQIGHNSNNANLAGDDLPRARLSKF